MKFEKSKKMNISLKKQKVGGNFFLAFLSIGLSLFGLLMIFNTSTPAALKDFGLKHHYFFEQARWLILGTAAMIFFIFCNYHKLYKFALPGLLVTIVFLSAVFIPGLGISALGASRWLNLGLISFQPAELAKLTLSLYLAAWFTYKEKGRFLSFSILLILLVGLIVIEPDLGTAGVVCTTAIILYFLSGAPLWHFLLLIPTVGLAGLSLSVVSPYRFQRILTFLNPTFDPQGASYHLRQILIALSSGDWFGLGLGKSRQKFAYLPEATTDSIFAIIGEELGFLGTSLVLFCLFLLVMMGIKIVLNAPDRFGRLLSCGLVSTLTLQIIVNLASMVSLVPLTGLPLPFISYGGSNLVVSFSMIGILVNISRQS